MKVSTPPREPWLDLKSLLLAGLLSAGHFKEDPRLAWLPADLTLLFAAAALAAVAWEVIRHGFRVSAQIPWVLLLFGLFALPVMWTDLHPYAAEKVTYLFTLTLLAAVAPFLLCHTRGDVRRFLRAMVLVGWIIALDATAQLVGNHDLLRLTAFSESTIALGRDVGVPLLYTVLLAIERRMHLSAALPAAGLFGVLLVGSGSRGPLLAGVGTLVGLGLFCYTRIPGLFSRVAAATLLTVGVLAVGLLFAPAGSSHRIETFLQGDLGRSELGRLQSYEDALQVIPEHSMGIGWGGFASQLDRNGLGGQVRQYPHNIILETWLEGGWLSGIYLGALLLVALGRLVWRNSSVEVRLIFGMLLFFVINALVSGDLNDNRALFAFAALGLDVGRWDPA